MGASVRSQGVDSENHPWPVLLMRRTGRPARSLLQNPG